MTTRRVSHGSAAMYVSSHGEKARLTVPGLLPGLLCRQAKPSGAGVVMVQSRDDETVDYRDTRRLAQAMGARLIELQDAGRGHAGLCEAWRSCLLLLVCVIRWRDMTWRGAMLLGCGIDAGHRLDPLVAEPGGRLAALVVEAYELHAKAGENGGKR